MLRPFPTRHATSSDLSRFQAVSDALLKPMSSTYVPPSPGPTLPYDDSVLAELTNLSNEILAQVQAQQQQVASENAPVPAFDTKTQAQKADLKRRGDSGDESDGFILKMVFDIVPIGINIAKKGKTIATGFKEVGMGIVELITNIALLTATLVIDGISFVVQLFIFLFKLLLCSVTIISNFPKCLTFYIIDIIMIFVFVSIISILFIIDLFLMVKSLTGTSCIEIFIMILGIIEKIDKAIYTAFSFHLIHYPERIMGLCYKCSAMGDTSRFMSAASRMFKDIFIDVPSGIGGPIGEALGGIGHIFSFLDIG